MAGYFRIQGNVFLKMDAHGGPLLNVAYGKRDAHGGLLLNVAYWKGDAHGGLLLNVEYGKREAHDDPKKFSEETTRNSLMEGKESDTTRTFSLKKSVQRPAQADSSKAAKIEVKTKCSIQPKATKDLPSVLKKFAEETDRKFFTEGEHLYRIRKSSLEKLAIF